MRRAQMEIMGLAIIIILVMLGLLFAVQWLLKSPATKQTQTAKEAEFIGNFLSALPGTTTDCNKRNVGELLRDCALTQGATKCGAQTSCEYAHDIIEDIIKATLEKWNYKYYFQITGASSVETIKFGKACAGAREKKEHPLPVTPGFNIKLSLEICG